MNNLININDFNKGLRKPHFYIKIKAKECSVDFTLIFLYTLSLSVLFYLFGSTINYYMPTFDENKDEINILAEIFINFVICISLSIFSYYAVKKILNIEDDKFINNIYVFLILGTTFVTLFFVTQTKLIRNVRLLSDRIWNEPEPVIKEPINNVIMVKQIFLEKPKRGTSIDDILNMNYGVKF